jgi:hypothetical protein
VRWIAALVLCCVGCSSTDLEVMLEGEDGPYDYQWKPLPVGAGLVSEVSVYRVDWQTDYDDPDITAYTADQLSFTIDGGDLVSCGDGKTCVTATRDRIAISASTPDGAATGSRSVVDDLRLAAFTPSWGHVTVDAIHLEVGTTSRLDPVFRESSAGVVSGHADLAASGPIALAGNMVMVTAPGTATISAPSLPAAPPLTIRAVTRDVSLASIASFTADRVFYPQPLASLKLYTESPPDINSFVIEAFDADGALALYGLPFTARGSALAPADLTGNPCTTGDYCFLHPALPDGVNDLNTELELSAGSAVQTIPVHIVRAAY